MIFQQNVTIKNVCKEDLFLFLIVILKKKYPFVAGPSCQYVSNVCSLPWAKGIEKHRSTCT